MEKTTRARQPRILASCRAPCPGELFYGYIRDLVLMNEMKTINGFERNCASPAGTSRIYLEQPRGLAILCQNIGNKTFPSMKHILSMTTFYEKASGLSPGRIQSLSETIIYPICQGVCGHCVGVGRRLCICQACWDEDVSQYGFGYLHVGHHLSGVKVCRIHGLPLKNQVPEAKTAILKPIFPYLWEEYAVPDLRRAVEQAEASYSAFKKGMASIELLEGECRECGAKYIAHPRSILTGAGCPVCIERLDTHKWVSERILHAMGNNWKVMPGFTSPINGQVTHKDRQYIRLSLWDVLYGETYKYRYISKKSGGESIAP